MAGRHIHTLMRFRLIKIAAVTTTLFLAVGLRAQTSAVPVNGALIDQQFGTYNDSILSAADEILKRVSLDGSPTPHSDAATPNSPPQLAEFARSYWDNRQQALVAAVERVNDLAAVVKPILRAEGVPEELLAVVLVESAGRPTALSPKGARGLWQFMPATATRYGLHVSDTHDERLSVEKATRSAAKYLRDLYARFGDWRLAIASYNAGEGAVERAARRVGSREFTQLSFHLPAETRAYVPAVLAAAELFGDGGALQSPPSSRRGDLSLPVTNARRRTE